MSLEEIKEEYAKEKGSDNWVTFQCREEVYFDVDALCRQYAKAKLEEVVEEITKLHSESKKLERKVNSNGLVEFGKTSGYRNCLNIIKETPLD